MSSGLALETEGGGWKRYPVYKDSGVEWLGAVPEGWRTMRAKYCSKINMGQSPSSEDCSIDHIGLPFLQGNAEFGAVSPTPKQYCGVARKVTHTGDLLISVRAPVGALNVADQDYGIGRGLCGITPNETNLNSAFCWHLLHYVRVQLNLCATGSTYDAVSSDDVGNMVLVIPPLSEQRAIAAFLDHETGRIDALVAKKERQIKLLREKRAALISHAVTKGLDPDAPMKDSGVEWFGAIPVGWAASKTKYVATLRTGHTPSRQHPEYWRDCTIPWFSLADVWQLRDGRREYLGETKEKISTLGLANSSAELLPANTVIVSRTASVGFSGIMPEPMATTQDFVNWVCSPKIQPEYLLYVFRSMEHEFKRLTMGSTHKTIYMPDAASFQTPVPPIGEQKQIVKYVQKHKRSLEHVEDLVAVSIEKLHEYRTALISAAVTGKIDVRSDET